MWRTLTWTLMTSFEEMPCMGIEQRGWGGMDASHGARLIDWYGTAGRPGFRVGVMRVNAR